MVTVHKTLPKFTSYKFEELTYIVLRTHRFIVKNEMLISIARQKITHAPDRTVGPHASVDVCGSTDVDKHPQAVRCLVWSAISRTVGPRHSPRTV
jgi:hypothetical protein